MLGERQAEIWGERAVFTVLGPIQPNWLFPADLRYHLGLYFPTVKNTVRAASTKLCSPICMARCGAESPCRSGLEASSEAWALPLPCGESTAYPQAWEGSSFSYALSLFCRGIQLPREGLAFSSPALTPSQSGCMWLPQGPAQERPQLLV